MLNRNFKLVLFFFRLVIYMVMIRGMMIRMVFIRNGNFGKLKLDDWMYIGLKIKVLMKL